MRLIDADAAKARMIEISAKVFTEINFTTFPIVAGMINKFDCEDDFPTIEVVPVIHSKWVSHDNSSHKFCENCGIGFNILFYQKNDYRFCPYCGAKMDEGEENI